MHNLQRELDTGTARISPFVDYIDSIIKELREASAAIHQEPSDLAEFISSTQALEKFVRHCSTSKTSLRLDVLHAVTKIDNTLYRDVLRPALLSRIQVINSDK